MSWFASLFLEPGVAHSLILLALTIAIGLSLSKIKFGSISLGVTWILFVGIVFGHFGLVLDPEIGHFVKEFGLILFIYSIGIEVGPGFFNSFRKGGILLNVLALTVIVLGSLMAVGFWKLFDIEGSSMIGVLYGAVTNTPGLGAAQQTFSDMNGGITNPLFAQGYAVAYPLGVVGIILSITVLKFIFKVDFKKEDALYKANAARNGVVLQERIQEQERNWLKKLFRNKSVEPQQTEGDHPNLFFIFIGIALGVLLGMIPMHIPGIPVPVRLGLAGGPLIVSILLAYFGPRIHIATYTTRSANLMIRQIGISLFMAAVGIGAGEGFIDTICNGGYWWILYGFIITIVPLLIVGLIARYVCHLSYFTIAGMLSGSMTDPPALAYSNSLCGSDQASVAYSTVYPLSMFFRVIVAQVLVLLLCA